MILQNENCRLTRAEKREPRNYFRVFYASGLDTSIYNGIIT